MNNTTDKGPTVATPTTGIDHAATPPDRMLKWFEYSILPEHLMIVSMPFHKLANGICRDIMAGPERTVALRKLLEAKDAAVRAVVSPGG
jgi:hypothetical protein